MVHSKELYYKTFNHFNDLIFDGAIIKPKIKSFNSIKYAGYFIGEPDEEGNPAMVIKISTKYNKNYKTFCETLIHEMIHCFQYLNRMPVNHGKSFKIMAKHIKDTLGLNVK